MNIVAETLRKQRVKYAGKEQTWETRRDALESLRKICKAYMLCGVPVVEHEIKEDGAVLTGFARAISRIVKGIDRDKKAENREEGLAFKLEELMDFCGCANDMPGLVEIVEAF